jgi:hypothetical protein
VGLGIDADVLGHDCLSLEFAIKVDGSSTGYSKSMLDRVVRFTTCEQERSMIPQAAFLDVHFEVSSSFQFPFFLVRAATCG